jgi:alpha-1,2-mannosyltransferase
MRAAFHRLRDPLFLGVLPAAAVVYLFVVALRTGSLAVDFHNELYPQAREMLAGRNPYPPPDGIRPIGNFVWPPIAALLAAPFTVLPLGVADVVWAIAGLLCFGVALYVVSVRDWRVYGAALLWVPVAGEIRTTHLTPLLCVLLALAWRYRHRVWMPGAAIGFAIALKFFLWPMAFWLLCRRNLRGAALACGLAVVSLALVQAFTGIDEYVRLLHRLTQIYAEYAYSPYGLLAKAGAGDVAAQVVSLAVGFAVLLVAWRRRSFGLFVGAALLLSPIVWIDYYALLIVPLAVVRPTFRPVWLLPIVTWGLPSGAGHGFQIGPTLWVLTVFAAMLWLIARAERPPKRRGASHRRRHRTIAAASG